MRSIPLDLRHTIRALRREKLYAGAVIVTLALTLGAATVVFSIVNGVILRPLAFPDPERLVTSREAQPAIAARYPTSPVNARHFEEWRRRTTTLAMAALDWRRSNLTGAGDPVREQEETGIRRRSEGCGARAMARCDYPQERHARCSVKVVAASRALSSPWSRHRPAGSRRS